MNTPVIYNRILDDKGRVSLPQPLHVTANMSVGDIVRLEVVKGNITIRKLDIVEIGDYTPAARDALVAAAVDLMEKEALLELITHITKRIKYDK